MAVNVQAMPGSPVMRPMTTSSTPSRSCASSRSPVSTAISMASIGNSALRPSSGGTTATIERGVALVEQMLAGANQVARQPVAASHLVVGALLIETARRLDALVLRWGR